MRLPNAVPDAPVYKATLREMESLPDLLAVAGELAVKHGAVRIDPPPEWTPPPLRMARNSRFFVREQTLPAAPLVDLTPPADAVPHVPVARRRRRVVEGSEDEEEGGEEEGKEKDVKEEVGKENEKAGEKVEGVAKDGLGGVREKDGLVGAKENLPMATAQGAAGEEGEVKEDGATSKMEIVANSVPVANDAVANTAVANTAVASEDRVATVERAEMSASKPIVQSIVNSLVSLEGRQSTRANVDTSNNVSTQTPTLMQPLAQTDHTPVQATPPAPVGNGQQVETQSASQQYQLPHTASLLRPGTQSNQLSSNPSQQQIPSVTAPTSSLMQSLFPRPASQQAAQTPLLSQTALPSFQQTLPSMEVTTTHFESLPPPRSRLMPIGSTPPPASSYMPSKSASTPITSLWPPPVHAEYTPQAVRPMPLVRCGAQPASLINDLGNFAANKLQPLVTPQLGQLPSLQHARSNDAQSGAHDKVKLVTNGAFDGNDTSWSSPGRVAKSGRGSIGSLLNPSGPEHAVSSGGLEGGRNEQMGANGQIVARMHLPNRENEAREGIPGGDTGVGGMQVAKPSGDSQSIAQREGNAKGQVSSGEVKTIVPQGSDRATLVAHKNVKEAAPVKSDASANEAMKQVIQEHDLANQLAAATQESSNEQLKASGNMEVILPDSCRDSVKGQHAPVTNGLGAENPSVVQQRSREGEGRVLKASQQDASGDRPVGSGLSTERSNTDSVNPFQKIEVAEAPSVKKNGPGEAKNEGNKPVEATASQDLLPSGSGELREKELDQGTDEGTTGQSMGRSKSAQRHKAKRQRGRPPHKRRVNHISFMSWDQDENGRLTVPIVFPDSPSTVSLSMYEKKALSFQEDLRALLLEDKSLGLGDLEKIRMEENKDWLRNIDVLEKIFWTSLRKGVGGKPISVAYGVDVEAEGAFDSAGKGYVEWYGVDSSGRMVKKGKKGKIEKKEVKEELCINEANDGDIHNRVESKTIPRGQGRAGNEGNSARPQKQPGVLETEVLVAEGKGSEDQTEDATTPQTGPKSHVGNLNRSGLLRHMPRMPGINHSMYYVGQLFTRFCWHVEDAFLNSVSYLHHGSAEKVWYAIPPKFAPAFEAYASENMFAEHLMDEFGSGQALLMNKTTISDPRDLQSRGIEVFRVVHKPGTFVLTAPRGYHAGFNCGFNVAEAVNFALPPWFPVGREASKFARENQKPLCVPWEYLLFHEAKAMRDKALMKRTKQESHRVAANARILATELDSVVTTGEQRIREYATRKNCRIAMLSEIDALVKNNQLGPEFGHGAGMVCSLCGHACHFYAEICASCDNSFEARCEQHFGQGHKLCSVPGHKTILVRRHDPVLLADVLITLEEIAGVQKSKEELLSRFTGYLRPWETPLRSSGLRLRMNLKLAASRLPPNLANGKPTKDGVKRERRKRYKKYPDLSKKRECESEDEAPRRRKRRKAEGPKKPTSSSGGQAGAYLEIPQRADVPQLTSIANLPPALDGMQTSIARATPKINNGSVDISKDACVEVSKKSVHL